MDVQICGNRHLINIRGEAMAQIAAVAESKFLSLSNWRLLGWKSIICGLRQQYSAFIVRDLLAVMQRNLKRISYHPFQVFKLCIVLAGMMTTTVGYGGVEESELSSRVESVPVVSLNGFGEEVTQAASRVDASQQILAWNDRRIPEIDPPIDGPPCRTPECRRCLSNGVGLATEGSYEVFRISVLNTERYIYWGSDEGHDDRANLLMDNRHNAPTICNLDRGTCSGHDTGCPFGIASISSCSGRSGEPTCTSGESCRGQWSGSAYGIWVPLLTGMISTATAYSPFRPYDCDCTSGNFGHRASFTASATLDNYGEYSIKYPSLNSIAQRVADAGVIFHDSAEAELRIEEALFCQRGFDLSPILVEQRVVRTMHVSPQPPPPSSMPNCPTGQKCCWINQGGKCLCVSENTQCSVDAVRHCPYGQICCEPGLNSCKICAQPGACPTRKSRYRWRK